MRAPDGSLAQVDAETKAQIQAVARTCAELFLQSSSYVEGRNGQLASTMLLKCLNPPHRLRD